MAAHGRGIPNDYVGGWLAVSAAAIVAMTAVRRRMGANYFEDWCPR